MRRVEVFLKVMLFLMLIFPLTTNASGIEYDRTFSDDNTIVLRGTETSDGCYAVLTAYSGDDNAWFLEIFKYSDDGELIWNKPYKSYSLYLSDLKNVIIGFSELDNGNFYVATNDFVMVISSTGELINSYDMADQLGKQYYNGGFRCEDSICVGVNLYDNDNGGTVFKVDDNGSVSKVVDIPQVSLVPDGESKYLGIPVSLFKNRDGNYVVETIEGTVTYIYVFDKNLNQISKDLFAINNSGINVFNITGNIYWVLGQFNNGNYFGVNIDYKGSTGISSASYILLSNDLTSVLKENKIAESYLDMQSRRDMTQQQEAILYSLVFTGYYAMADGVRDGRYISLLGYDSIATKNCYKRAVSVPKNSGIITYAFDRNISYGAVNLDSRSSCGMLSFRRIDSNLNIIEEDSIGVIPRYSIPEMEFLINRSSVVRLKDGSDIVVTNSNQSPNSNLARHIKIDKLLVAASIAANPNDITFEKDIYQAGDIVKMQLRQKDGYYIDKVIVRDETGKIIPVDLKNQTFVMPESDVTVDVQYKKIEQVKTGILASIILSLMALGIIGFSSIKYFKKQTVN